MKQNQINLTREQQAFNDVLKYVIGNRNNYPFSDYSFEYKSKPFGDYELTQKHNIFSAIILSRIENNNFLLHSILIDTDNQLKAIFSYNNGGNEK